MSTNNNPGCLAAALRLFGLEKMPPKASFDVPQPEIEGLLPYRLRDDFLTPAEASFFQVLKSMTGDKLLICPKVSLAELFFVPHREESQAYQNKIDRKRVDFVLCTPQTLKPIFAIELDDSSHARPDRQERDEFVDKVFAITRLPLVRVPVRPAYNTQELAILFQGALRQPPEEVAANPQPAPNPGTPPICPKCGVVMVLRTAKRGNTPGQQFFGCPNYPRCRVVLPIKGAGL